MQISCNMCVFVRLCLTMENVSLLLLLMPLLVPLYCSIRQLYGLLFIVVLYFWRQQQQQKLCVK